ncbi:MAG: hypothetical protein R3C51_12760 [Parvularculaceae bacterium]
MARAADIAFDIGYAAAYCGLGEIKRLGGGADGFMPVDGDDVAEFGGVHVTMQNMK